MKSRDPLLWLRVRWPYLYVENQPIRLVDPSGLKVYICRVPDLGRSYNVLFPSHVYLKVPCQIPEAKTTSRSKGLAWGFSMMGVMDNSAYVDEEKTSGTRCEEVKCIDEGKLCKSIRKDLNNKDFGKKYNASWPGFYVCGNWAVEKLRDPSVQDRCSPECRGLPYPSPHPACV